MNEQLKNSQAALDRAMQCKAAYDNARFYFIAICHGSTGAVIVGQDRFRILSGKGLPCQK
jgi:hypothetical protein